jgi:hypothetical protein
MFSTGEYVPGGTGNFAQKEWGARTAELVVILSKMKRDRWVGVMKAVRLTLKEKAKRAEVAQGPPPSLDADAFIMPDSDPVVPPNDPGADVL